MTSAALDDFYRTFAQLCFTLLGFWWAALQFRFHAWVHDAARRREAYAGGLYFLLPGAMALMASISGEGALWRAAFVVVGALGVVAALSPGSRAAGGPVLRAASGLLHAAIVAVAAVPELAGDLQPRAVEAVFVSLITLVGVQAAWSFFTSESAAERVRV